MNNDTQVNSYSLSEKGILDSSERIAKIFALVMVPVLVALIPSCISNQQKDKEISLKYTELAISVLKTPDTKKELRIWAIKVLNENSPSKELQIDSDLQKEFEERKISFPHQLMDAIADGEYMDVPVGNFLDMIVAAEHFEEEVIEGFIDRSIEYLNDIIGKNLIHDEDWEIKINGGVIGIIRTRNKNELQIAQKGMLDVLEAIKNRKDIQGITIKIRGNEKFYDINDLSGINPRTWVFLDLR